MYEIESVSHLLFNCTYYDALGAQLYMNVISNSPTAMSEILLNVDTNFKTELLLTCLHNTYNEEWTEFYKAIVNFIFTMYKERLKLDVL